MTGGSQVHEGEGPSREKEQHVMKAWRQEELGASVLLDLKGCGLGRKEWIMEAGKRDTTALS